MKYNEVRPFLAVLFLIIVIFSSCDKQNNGTGIGLFARNNDLGISYIDSFTVNSKPVAENNVRTSGFSEALLGSYFDPFFGNTKISFYTQFLIFGTGIDFKDQIVCDSIVFYAKLGVSSGDEYYGPENKEMTFNVHRISSDADFSIDSNYFTFSSLEIFNESLLDPIFNNTFTPNFNDTVQIGLDTVNKFVGVLQLKLDPSFGQEIIDLNGTDVLSSNEEFQKVYKGLYITTDGGLSWQNKTTSTLDDERLLDVLYQAGTNDIVYVASATGLFYWDINSTDWIDYGSGLPLMTRALELKPFYKENKIRFGCYF